MTGDLLIKDATLIDGSGSQWRRGSVLVDGGRITAVGDLRGASAGREIDAGGKVLAPGFIDTHVHTDMTLLDEPVHECFLRQGVTTVIQGQDGLSYAPLAPANLAMYRRYLAGLNGNARSPASWESVAQYRAAFDRTVTMNTAYCFPHAAARLETVGFQDVPLEGDDLKRARRLLEVGFEEGAVAFSTGLSYFPNTYGDTDEHVALCEVAAGAGRPYVTHVRSVFESPVDDWLMAGLEEAVTIGVRSGAPVHISHFGPKPWRYPTPDIMLRLVAAAREQGATVTLELYPYPSGNTYLLIYLPPWAHVGGPDAILELIRSGRERDRLVREIEGNTIAPFGTTVSYLGSGPDPRYVGRTLDAIAADWGVPVGEAVLRLLDMEDLVVGGREAPPSDRDVLTTHMDQVLEVLGRGDYMVGSDGIPVAQFPHPRTFGTFPRIVRFARETGKLPLERVVEAMTSLPARTFGLTDRGILRQGAFADLVLFDPQALEDHASYDDPIQLSTGIDGLWVNGEAVIDEGRVTSARPGRAIP
ncbi:MAG: D-aminoacylase [Trueperaceae bacterium]